MSLMRLFFIFIIAIFLPLTLTAQKVKIIAVPEANLFELNTGEKVRLANIRLPNPLSADSEFGLMHRIIQISIEKDYKNKWFEIHHTGFTDSSGYPLVHLKRKYPLNTFYLNQYYLQKGYGWYVSNADSLYQKKYKRAAQDAKKYKRGVWNPQEFKPLALSDYAVSFLYGYLKHNDMEDKTTFEEFMIRIAPAKNISGFEVKGAVFYKQESRYVCCTDNGIDFTERYVTEETRGYSISGVFHGYARWAGFSIGATFFRVNDEYYYERNNSIFIPHLSAKAGWMEKIYFSFSLWDYYRISEYTAGVNYIFDNSVNRLWIGIGRYQEVRNCGFELDYNVLWKFILHVQGGYLLKDKPEFMGRIGLGIFLH